MTERRRDRSPLEPFDTDADRSGQAIRGVPPPDVGWPARAQDAPRSDPGGKAARSEAIERATAVVGADEQDGERDE